MKWVTREGAKVDRIACPWLVRKFVDKDAEFLYVPAAGVLETANKEGAISFDAPGAEFAHFMEGGEEFVTFDAIIKRHSLRDEALLELAAIVREQTPKSPATPPISFFEAINPSPCSSLSLPIRGSKENITLRPFRPAFLSFPLRRTLTRQAQRHRLRMVLPAPRVSQCSCRRSALLVRQNERHDSQHRFTLPNIAQKC